MTNTQLEFLDAVEAMGTDSAYNPLRIPEAIAVSSNSAYETAYRDAQQRYGTDIILYAHSVSHQVTPVPLTPSKPLRTTHEKHYVSVLCVYHVYRTA